MDDRQEPQGPRGGGREWNDDLEADLRRILSVGEECISEGELKSLILAKGRGASTIDDAPRIRLYDGFEPSGRMHIAQGLLKSVNVNKCTLHGTNSTFVFWVADWFALMNDKMGGDLHKITIVGRYLIEVWKAAGMDLSNVEFRWASEEINDNAHVYWPIMMDVARRFNVTRIKKCCQIMGRLEGNLTAAQVLYPLMQCTDVFFLRADICQLGVDQRKVNMLAREYCDHAKDKKIRKPVILSHHMLYGLKEGQEKMSKSDPDSAIFMEDGAEDMERKIRSAYCPTAVSTAPVAIANSQQADLGDPAMYAGAGDAKEEEEEDAGKESMHLVNDDDSALKNPILDYVRHIVLSPPGSTFPCCRSAINEGVTDAMPARMGGDGEKTEGEDIERVVYKSYDDVKSDFLRGRISPDQLKDGLVIALNELLQPVRDHFETDDGARVLLEQVREFKRTTTSSSSASTVGEKDAPPKVFRLDLVEAGVVPPSCHLVMAPLPECNPTLQSIADVLAMLRGGGADDGESAAFSSTKPVVLMLLDWTARVNSSLDADPKLISAYYAVLLSALRALDDHLHGGDTMKNVTVVMQSEAILRDPSNYWISVINAGRHFSLDEVMTGSANNVGSKGSMKDSEGVGKVIGRLMMIADVMAVNPYSIALLELSGVDGDDAAKGMGNMSIEEGNEKATQSVEEHLIVRFFSTKLSHPGLASFLAMPRISHVGGTDSSSTRGARLGLQPPRESAAHRADFDEYFVTDDPKVHGKSKMKKAFCEPGNVAFCPPIELLAYFGGLQGGGANGARTEVTISRTPDNGGDVTYTTKSALFRDFESGALHPGDLKGAVSNIMVEVLTKISAEIKRSDAAVKGVKALKAYEKKMTKLKKK
jgi:tyrosyl-tRNA synthetase